MKKLFLPLAAVAMLFIGSCDEPINVTVTLNNVTTLFTIPADTSTGMQTFASQALQTQIDSVCQAHNADKNSITSVKLTSMKIEIIDGLNNNFNAAGSFEAYLQGSGLSQVKVAFKDPVPQNVSLINLDVYTNELVDHFKANTINYILKGNKVGMNPPIGCKATLNFDIVLNVNPS